MLRILLIGILLNLIGFMLTAQIPGEMPLYKGAIPNSKPTAARERVDTRPNGTRFIIGTTQPTLTAFIPPKPNGQGVVICPGGGYSGTAIDHEGLAVAKAFNALGVAAFVLKYRMPLDTSCIDRSIAPLQDAQQAIRLVRQNAKQWKVNPRKIGIMGFSAGGHLASTAATHFFENADPAEKDTTSVRPDFAILIYPVISFNDELAHGGSRGNLLGKNYTEVQKFRFSNEQQVTAASPPAFLVHSADDKTVEVENSIAYYLACHKYKIPVEMHLYPKGGHGYGMNNPTTSDKWFERLGNWLKTL
ncbi:alpha/beta hydrolase [Haliscomenobacter hydrossis]|uniref:Alpha/beta hydrolase n=1 Tax=Haliscomenobacter hydrossis (strain ATCC 27775 / DSM 1100 / LMG 10767 / O) TaxID=760192 RepID=F4L4G5_HALH1|nr:alpha/beta hydrolase [Haliscomenobacter hydrossis]AEE51966.1 alpha/beta hydrolase [Haliscomenobacter hydrossis DSM 1100]